MSERKFRVPAEVAVRPVETFDHESGGWCRWHRTADATHIVTFLVEGHAVAATPACDECAALMEHGADWSGRPARREDRAL
jgi:hypothetical protein